MNEQATIDPVDQVLSFVNDGPEVEHFSVEEIEASPIEVITTRLRQLGIDPALESMHDLLNTIQVDKKHGLETWTAGDLRSKLLGSGPSEARAEGRTSAVDNYISTFVRTNDLHPSTLRRRLVLCAVMGGVPGGMAIGVAILMYAGLILTTNGVKFAELLIGGGLVTAVLAIMVAIQAVLEAYVHQWLIHRSREDETVSLAMAIDDLVTTRPAIGHIVLSHLRRYTRLRGSLSGFRSR